MNTSTVPALSPRTSIQQANVTALEALSDPARDIVVEAWAMTEPVNVKITAGDTVIAEIFIGHRPAMATEPCSNDTAHGKGCCYGPTGDALCLACQIAWLEQDMVTGSSYSIDVAA